MKKLTLLLLCVLSITLNAQILINSETFMDGISPGQPIEKWDYNIDATIWPFQWNCSNESGNSAGSSPVAVETPLQYPGFYTSTKPNAFKMENLASGGRSTVFSITSLKEYYTGSFYLAFMIKVESFPGSGTVGVVMFDGSHRASFRKTCLALRKIDENTFSFGIDMAEYPNVGANTPVTGKYNIGTTYLVVMRHDFDTDKYYLYVNPDVNKGEPTALLSGTNTGTPLGNNGLRGITVKQRSQYSAIIGGLCLAKSWESALSFTSATDNILSTRGNVISKEYYSLTGAKIERPTQSSIYVTKSQFENGDVEWSKVIYKDIQDF